MITQKWLQTIITPRLYVCIYCNVCCLISLFFVMSNTIAPDYSFQVCIPTISYDWWPSKYFFKLQIDLEHESVFSNYCFLVRKSSILRNSKENNFLFVFPRLFQFFSNFITLVGLVHKYSFKCLGVFCVFSCCWANTFYASVDCKLYFF